MGDEADAKGGQPWRFDIRIVSLDDLPQDVEGVAVLWAKGEVRVSFVTASAFCISLSFFRFANPLLSVRLLQGVPYSTLHPS
jgi:hypothetical protein